MSAVFSGSVSFKSDGYLAEKCSVSIKFYKAIDGFHCDVIKL